MTDNKRISFYANVVSQWIKDRNASTLVVAGGLNDRNVFGDLGFTNVIISNLDTRMQGDEFTPFRWSFQNAESLAYDGCEFDYAVVNAALHHCSSPHRALLEMYRVARRAAILIESRDSLVMRALEALRFTSTYETTAVYYNECQYGGVNNTNIPNFVYRWTEREIEKTISSHAPYASHRFHYRYGNDIPDLVSRERNGGLKALIVALAKPAYRAFACLFPKQQNLFACMIEKPVLPRDLHFWITLDGDSEMKFNREWADKIYKPSLPQ